MTFDYPLSKQDEFVSFNVDRLREIAPEVATAFRGLREAADAHGPLDAKQRELTLLTGFAATRNEGGFRVHCTRAARRAPASARSSRWSSCSSGPAWVSCPSSRRSPGCTTSSPDRCTDSQTGP